MNYGCIAYLLKGSDTVVVDKKQIRNAKDDDFEEIRLILSKEFIKEQSDRMNGIRIHKKDDEDKLQKEKEFFGEDYLNNLIAD